MVLDTSTSIDEFETMKEFALFFTSEFQFGVGGARFAVITVGSFATVSVSLGEHMTSAAYHEAVSNIEFQGGRGDVADAINLATQQFLSFGQNAEQIIVVFAAGIFPMHNRAVAAAAIARGHDIKMVTVGKEFAINQDQLKAISSDPDDQNVFLLSDFSSNSFDSVLKPLVQHICCKNVQFHLLLIYTL